MNQINLEQELKTSLKYSPRVFQLFGILAYLATGKIGFLSLTLYTISTEIIVNLVKNLFGDSKLSKSFVDRPGNENCGASSYAVSNIGMPSGHAAVASVFATVIIAKMWARGTGFDIFKMLRTVILIAVVIAVMYSRVEMENCHTWIQSLSGALFGVILGLIFWWISKLPVLRRFLNF